MATAGNVLVLLGTIVTAYGLWRVRRGNAPLTPAPAQHISPTGIPSGEAFGTPTVRQEGLSRSRAGMRKLAAKAKRWARFGRPVRHTADAHVVVPPTMTATAGMLVPHLGTDAERLARLQRQIDALAEEHVNTRAEDLKHQAQLIKQELNIYRAEQRAETRRQTLIPGIGVAMTIAGTVLLLLAG